jgi:hypothetical protein
MVVIAVGLMFLCFGLLQSIARKLHEESEYGRCENTGAHDR